MCISKDFVESQIYFWQPYCRGWAGVGGGTPDQLKLKVPRSAQIFILREGGGRGTADQLKLKVRRSAQIFMVGGGATADQLKLKMPRSSHICMGGGGGQYSRPTQTQSA